MDIVPPAGAGTALSEAPPAEVPALSEAPPEPKELTT